VAIEFQCETCNTTLRVSDEHAGKKAKCPKCKAINLIQAGVQTNKLHPQTPDAPADFYSHAGNSQDSTAAVAKPNPYQASNVGVGSGYVQPHRGAMILVLGIFAFMCNFMFVPGILAWTFGRADLKAIDAGRMDPEGRGLTMAGMILGIVGTVLPLVFILLYLLFIMVVLVFAAVGAAAQ